MRTPPRLIKQVFIISGVPIEGNAGKRVHRRMSDKVLSWEWTFSPKQGQEVVPS